MFGVSLPELITILVVVFVLFGPEKLPEIASSLGRLMGELRRNTDGLRREFYNSVYSPAQDAGRRIERELKAISSFEGGAAQPSAPQPAETKAPSGDTAPPAEPAKEDSKPT